MSFIIIDKRYLYLGINIVKVKKTWVINVFYQYLFIKNTIFLLFSFLKYYKITIPNAMKFAICL